MEFAMNWFVLSFIAPVNLSITAAGFYALVLVFGCAGTIPPCGAGAATCLLLPQVYRKRG